MVTFEHLDLLIGQALECIEEAASGINELSLVKQKKMLKHIGRSIVELWEVRDLIYEIRPDIKRDFAKEYSKDQQRFEYLNLIQRKAAEAEKGGDYELAINIYSDLLSKSKYGFFKLLSEAGLYRSMALKNRSET
jgi:hypothetical protein